MMHGIARTLFYIITLALLCACGDEPLNNPHPESETKANIFFSSFAERPKTLDPARAYSSNEYVFMAQIYEPPLQYHYLKRPYTLEPVTIESMPSVSGNKTFTTYTLKLKPGRRFQPHPAFARDEKGELRYQHIDEDYLEDHDIYALSDFQYTDTRELTADDYIYQIKRLAHPGLNSPIFGLMSEHIVGLKAYAQQLQKIADKQGNERFLDLRKYPLKGVKKLDKYTYQITINGTYPQFIYWLAMPFFAPMPWEADKFYAQPGMIDHNITLDWYPVGTGPYMLTKNNPNSEMVLTRNPNFAGEAYPSEGTPEDKANGLLVDAGKPMPFVDKVVFTLEKESVPRWNKFLQGYYDNSGISSDSFDQAITIDEQGKPELTPSMHKRGIQLQTNVGVSSFYMGFNMLDDVVGGTSERARKLRQAIAIALDYEEFIAIFLNGRGIPAQGPIPPGIFGYTAGQAGINPYVYTWKNDKPVRRSITAAKQLLAEAGYPDGRDIKTGQPLVLNYDVPASSGPDDKARFDWFRKQFAKLGIQLHIRATQYNRFQEKMRNGNAQIFSWGWHADYPDPENFLFLLYGPNGKVKYQGENAANYNNTEYNRLFDEMKNMANGPERLAIIKQMLAIVRQDSPWLWGFHPKNFSLSQQWNRATKPNELANNTMKYVRIDYKKRNELQKAWNKPIFWPLGVLLIMLIGSCLPVYWRYRQKEHEPRVK